MQHLRRSGSRILWIIAALLLPVLVGAQIILGKYSFGFPDAEPLIETTPMEKAATVPAFPAGVGGVSFDQVALPAPDLTAQTLTLSYDPTAPDGKRLNLVLDGRSATADLPDWMLLPIARYAGSDAYSCFTLFGHLADKRLEQNVLDADGRVLNYHPAFSNTLLGLRLAYMDMLLLYPEFTTDLPLKDGKPLLGTGEQEPDKAANEHGFALLGNAMNDIRLELQQQYRSYIISDYQREIAFHVTDGRLTLTGEPYFYCWRYKYEWTGYDQKAVSDSLSKALKAELNDALATNKYRTAQAWAVDKVIEVMHAYEGRYELYTPESDFVRILEMRDDLSRGVALMRYHPDALMQMAHRTLYEMEVKGIDHMRSYSEKMSALSARFAKANPAVWKATVQTMRYAAFFRYVRQYHPGAWLAFQIQIKDLKPLPEARTPTVLYPTDNAALKARLAPKR